MCITGRQKLLVMQGQHAIQLAKTANNPVGDCNRSDCPTTRFRCAEGLCSLESAGFLDYLEDNVDSYAEDICAACSAAFEKTYTQEIQHMWDDLPSMFSLPSWQDLLKTEVAFSD